MELFELPVLNYLLPILFFIYVIRNMFKRVQLISDKNQQVILLFVFLLFIVFSSVFLYNVSQFRNGESLSYGSDSNLYEEMLVELQNAHSFEDAKHYKRMSFDKKTFTVYLNSFFYRLIPNNFANSLIVFFFNILYHLSSVIIAFLLISKYNWQNTHSNNKLFVSIIVAISFAGLTIVPTFLRDSFNLFIILEILYLWLQEKTNKRNFLIFVGIVILIYTRPFFAIVVSTIFIVKYLVEKVRFKFNIRIALFLLLIFVGLTFIRGTVFYSFLRKLIEIHSGDLHHYEAYPWLIVEHGTIAQVNSLKLYSIALFRFVFGSFKFIFTPISFPYFEQIFIGQHASNAYFGFDSRSVAFLHAFFYNFLTFPLFVSFIFSLRKNIKEIVTENSKKIFYFLLIILMIIIVIYGMKFMGQRNQKIDYYFVFLLNLFLIRFSINKNGFFIGFFIMFILNSVYLINFIL